MAESPEKHSPEAEKNNLKLASPPDKSHQPKVFSPHDSPPPRGRQQRDTWRLLCTALTILLLIAGVVVLTLWLVYRPHKPLFAVVGAAIYQLNATSSGVLSSSVQFTLTTRNPNQRVAIIYDRLTAFVSYRNQEITPPALLPPLHHRSKETVSFSPAMTGDGVPVSQDVVNGLTMDQAYGVVPLKLSLLGRLRWKAGAVRTGKHSVYVKCDVYLGFKKGVFGQVPLVGSSNCNVDM